MTISDLSPFINTILVALISSGGTYWVVRRTKSGRIDTTEAATLWKESNDMRKELRDEVVDLKEQLTEARHEIGSQRNELELLRQRVKELEAKA